MTAFIETVATVCLVWACFVVVVQAIGIGSMYAALPLYYNSLLLNVQS